MVYAGGGTTVHLLSALDHESSAVLAQLEVGVKTNEIPLFPVLLDEIGDLTSVVVTADALHAQCAHAAYLHKRGADYLITIRTTKAVTVEVGIDFPHAAQVVQITRRTRPATGPRRWSTEVAYAVTSAPAHAAGPEALGRWVRGHWGI